MATKRKRILHMRSRLRYQDGSPKLPKAEDLEYGELSINYAKGAETIAIKNSENELVSLPLNGGDIDGGTFGASYFIAYGEDERFEYYLNVNKRREGHFGMLITLPDDLTTTAYMFDNCEAEFFDFSQMDTSDVTNMEGMFKECFYLSSLDLSAFDTSKVISMREMFVHCSQLSSVDLTGFDTSNVTSMDTMFGGCENIDALDISSFDTSKASNMYWMFGNCVSLRYITLGYKFFKTEQPISFEDSYKLGFNEDNTDNGWLGHLAEVAPTITDGRGRTIQLHANLKNASWASAHLETLQSKGYTIA